MSLNSPQIISLYRATLSNPIKSKTCAIIFFKVLKMFSIILKNRFKDLWNWNRIKYKTSLCHLNFKNLPSSQKFVKFCYGRRKECCSYWKKKKIVALPDIPAFWLHNNLCESTALEHKFKRWFCTIKLVLNVRKDFWYIKIIPTQIWYDIFNL